MQDSSYIYLCVAIFVNICVCVTCMGVLVWKFVCVIPGVFMKSIIYICQLSCN